MKYVLVSILYVVSFMGLTAQDILQIPIDHTVETEGSVKINGSLVSYKATTGMQPLWDKEGKPEATLYYTYYQRKNVPNATHRPIVFSFNGGPGSASVWMHIAYTGPKILKIDDEGYPIQPYGIKDNPYSILDVADIVFVNPVNTGYSRLIPDADGKMPDRKKFFGVNADIKYLASWMSTFVTRNNRWESPKYIIGESYGGTRVMGLAHELQSRQWMYLNGVIMVSPADYKVLRTGSPLSTGLNLPYFAATAWHHKLLPAALQEQDLEALLPEVEAFTVDEYIPALVKGWSISPDEKARIAAKVAYYSGIDEKEILRQNLFLSTRFFWKELLRDESGHTIGRLDSRYKGIDKQDVGTSPEHNPELTAWLHAFTPAINYYIREHLNFKTDVKYNMFGNVHPWNRENDNVRDNLRKAMNQNPYLQVLVQSGYYDGATTYFQGKYTSWQIDPSGKMKDRFHFKGYRSGHMMYLRSEDLKKSNDDLRAFIQNSATNGKPAKYN